MFLEPSQVFTRWFMGNSAGTYCAPVAGAVSAPSNSVSESGSGDIEVLDKQGVIYSIKDAKMKLLELIAFNHGWEMTQIKRAQEKLSTEDMHSNTRI